ncbi:Cytochrome b561 domain-containing protein [Meloidogyne graminicola]|uniref:ascorbate ferrireductase (transmembrane) n=1 Tax=Meloidogyne graminicola TaxID=189291 RepID=A0A8T0A3S2_9BILA|nr:Cytochrome b561 domain-containing protein [Meloidogyne graminicola]
MISSLLNYTILILKKQKSTMISTILLFSAYFPAFLCQGSANNSTEISNVFLFKSHAVLMVFSWLLFAPIAILFARFQKDPLKRLLGEQLWFQVHRFSNTMTILCTFLAFICVLSATGGKWEGPKIGTNIDWGQVHSLSGIIATFLAFSQLISALFRCHPDSNSRIIFNVIHKIGGSLAWLFAVTATTIACTNFKLFANPSVAQILIFTFIALNLICIALMQILAVSKSEFQITCWIDQGSLFVIAFVILVAITFSIALLAWETGSEIKTILNYARE